MTLRRVAKLQRGSGFPQDDQGLTEGDLPFFKVGDFGRDGNERYLRSCTNWVSRETARELRAESVPPGSILLPKIGAALLGNARRIATREAVFDNNVLGVVPQRIDPRYLYYWLSTVDLAEINNPGPIPSLDDSAFLDIRVPCDNHETQRATADYLDTETARIDSLIEKKRQMIERVNERWQSELCRVLTPTTGVRLKHLLSAPLAYGVLVPEDDPTGVSMLRIMDLITGTVDLQTVARIPPTLSGQYRRTVVTLGDLVVSVVGTLGRSAEITQDLVGCNLNRALVRVQLRPEVPRNLVRYWFGSALFQDLARLATSSDSAQPTLGLGDLKNFIVGIPAASASWNAIAQQLAAERQGIDELLMSLGGQLELLHEHRHALITAAVTGELDIPGVAA